MSPRAEALRILTLATAASLFLCVTSIPRAAQGEESVLSVGVDVAIEQDDNITLGSGEANDEVVDDTVYRARPSLDLELPFGHHLVAVDCDGDLRKGTDTALDEYNARASGRLDLKFESGLGLRLYDTYSRTSFDQAIYFSEGDLASAEPGVSKTDGNTVGLAASFYRHQRFKIEGFLESTDERFDFGARGADSIDERDVNTASLRVSVPFSGVLLGYLASEVEDQTSLRRLTRVYDSSRHVAGLTWKTGKRLVAGLEVGHEEIDFADTADVDFSNGVAVVSVSVELGGETTGRASVGLDGFGEPIWELGGEWQSSSGDTVRLSARHLTQPSFSVRTVGRTFQATIGSLRWVKTWRKLNPSVELGYFALDSHEAGQVQDETTLFGHGILRYQIRHWLDAGIYVRYSERSSNLAFNRFNDTRAGVMLTVHN